MHPHQAEPSSVTNWEDQAPGLQAEAVGASFVGSKTVRWDLNLESFGRQALAKSLSTLLPALQSLVLRGSSVNICWI